MDFSVNVVDVSFVGKGVTPVVTDGVIDSVVSSFDVSSAVSCVFVVVSASVDLVDTSDRVVPPVVVIEFLPAGVTSIGVDSGSISLVVPSAAVDVTLSVSTEDVEVAVFKSVDSIVGSAEDVSAVALVEETALSSNDVVVEITSGSVVV